jgi:hypothetical protein
LINSCSALKSLDFHFVDALVSSIVQRFSPLILQQLTSFTVGNVSHLFTRKAINYLTSHCRNLVTFSYFTGGWGQLLSIHNSHFIELIQVNPQLKHIKIRQEHSQLPDNLCFLPIIADNCMDLESIEVGSDFLFSIANLTHLVNKCVNLNSISVTSHFPRGHGHNSMTFEIDKKDIDSNYIQVVGDEHTWTNETYICDLLNLFAGQFDKIYLSYRFETSIKICRIIIDKYPNLHTLILEYLQLDFDLFHLAEILRACKKLHTLKLLGFDHPILTGISQANSIKECTLSHIYGLTSEHIIALLDCNKQFNKLTIYAIASELIQKHVVMDFLTATNATTEVIIMVKVLTPDEIAAANAEAILDAAEAEEEEEEEEGDVVVVEEEDL